MSKLTAKQQEIYDYIVKFCEDNGYPPSVREIAAVVGAKSPSTVHFHIKSLQRAGLITQTAGKTRALSVTKPQCNRVPVVGNVAAGIPIWADQAIEDYLMYDTNGRDEEYFALKVRGDSMLNAGILPGDLVVVHMQPVVREGDIAVALFEDEATVKTFHHDSDGHVWLLPANNAYTAIDGEGCSILGRVVSVVRNY